MEENKLKFKNVCFSAVFFIVVFFGLSDKALASGASLYLSPLNGTYNTGGTFNVSVKLNSGGQSINAAEGTLVFSPEAFSVVSISKSGSIFNLWTTEPTFSNSNGSINFGGGTTVNYSGTSGTIVNITFRAKASGKYGVNFSAGSILASDGKGTNILSSMIAGSYVVSPQITSTPAEEPQYVPPKNTPNEAKITSSTHPDQDKWYANNEPKFSWNLPSDVIGVKLSVDRNPKSLPAKYYKEAISEKQLENVSDGIWYFHLELCNKSGCGKISNYKFQIDTANPEAFSIKAEGGEKTTNPQPVIDFEAKDAASGVDYYQIKIGDAGWFESKDAGYKLPLQSWGKHTILVKAVDRAGNSNLSATEIEILPLKSPQITDYPKQLVSCSSLPSLFRESKAASEAKDITACSSLYVNGTSLPDAIIKIYIQRGVKIEESQTKSDKNGNWFYVYDKDLKTGVYNIWAEATDLNGAKSDSSNKIAIIVTSPAFLRIGKVVIDYLTFSLILLALICAIVFGVVWAWERLRRKMERLMSDTTKAERSLFRAFKHLEKEVEREVAKIDDNPKLNKREKQVSENLKKALRSAEKFIGREIKDIEKELDK